MNSDVLRLGVGMVLFSDLLMNVGASSVGVGAKGIPTETEVAFEVLEAPDDGCATNSADQGQTQILRAIPPVGTGTLDSHGIDAGEHVGLSGRLIVEAGSESLTNLLATLSAPGADAKDDLGTNSPTVISDPGGTIQILSLGLAALAGIGWVRCRGEFISP